MKKPAPAIRSLAALIAAGVCAAGTNCAADADDPLVVAMERAQNRVVKLYGSRIGNEKGYGSGVVVSADGQIVTTSSLMLDGANLRAVLPTGAILPAKVIKRDARRQLALLKIDGNNLPHFDLGGSDHLQPGDWLVSAANAFKVADGPEPVGVSLGVFAARTNLAARRRAQDFTYEGPVLLTDVIVATPGAAGGAMVDAAGNLVGIIGKPVIGRRTNTWLNYAMPVEELAAFIKGDAAPRESVAAVDVAKPAELGIRLFDVGGRVRPAYVERVVIDSPARRAGVRADDLIVSVNDQTIATCDDFRRAAAAISAGTRVKLIVKRGEELLTIEIPSGGDTP